ncbi:MAG: hypothetical protein DI498_02380 [Paracoccus denitrificans]|nr:MAG: hypothetical protein DI498_02380 [Paracoccus denitrificans]PZO85994.1 MAG: hypothetical protein DI633_02380 [Paracoccus denitrificans]
MSDSRIVVTDPAREFVELLVELRSGDAQLNGADFLASHFQVKAWSQEYFRVLGALMDRLAELKSIVKGLNIDDDYRENFIANIESIEQIFTPSAFQNQWGHFGSDLLSEEHVGPLRGLSPIIRQTISYQKLSDAELEELLVSIIELTSLLSDLQSEDALFLRQALIEGLNKLRFRLERLKWLGHGYTLEALKEVIGAYIALERQFEHTAENPDAEAVLRGAKAFIRTAYQKVSGLKDVVETGDFILRAYGLLSIAKVGATFAAPLLLPAP